MRLLSNPRRIVVLGPLNSGRRSALGGLHEAIERYPEFKLESSQGTDRLANAIRSGEYPTHTKDRNLEIFTLGYSKPEFTSQAVEIVTPVVSDGYWDILLDDLSSRKPHGQNNPKDWEKLINNMEESKVKLSFIQYLANTVRAADLVVGIIPLVDFPGPLLSLVHQNLESSLSMPRTFRDRFVKKSTSETTRSEVNIETKAGIFVDTARRDRPYPVEYLRAYAMIENSLQQPKKLKLVVTMGDLAKSHFQSTLDDTETIQTSKPTAFCEFIKKTYFTKSSTYNKTGLVLPKAANDRPGVVWFDSGTETEISLRGNSPPLRGSLGLLLRAMD